jgi:hypothetical protein
LILEIFAKIFVTSAFFGGYADTIHARLAAFGIAYIFVFGIFDVAGVTRTCFWCYTFSVHTFRRATWDTCQVVYFYKTFATFVNYDFVNVGL